MRRLHLPIIAVGDMALPAAEAHHARHVLRLAEGTEIELFDDAGRTARAVLRFPSADTVIAHVTQITEPDANRFRFTIASAVPKGDRADWMIEKLSELGAARFIPLRTQRSVVHPQGQSKFDRWRRIAAESAKQCRRAGVMEIAELTDLVNAIETPGWFLSTQPDAVPVANIDRQLIPHLSLFIGPEGGWTDAEIALMFEKGLTPACFGDTVLRTETAAIAAAVVAKLFR